MPDVLPRRFVHRALLGVVAFGAIQAMLFSSPPLQTVAPPDHPGWFLNSGHGVLAVVAGLTVAAAAGALLWPATIAAASMPLAGGAVLAMIATYLWLGGGNLFPIVLGVGAGCIAVAAFLGSSLAFLARKAGT